MAFVAIFLALMVMSVVAGCCVITGEQDEMEEDEKNSLEYWKRLCDEYEDK